MFPLTPEQEAAVEANRTKPNYLFRISLDQAYFWSTNAIETDHNSIEYMPGYLRFGTITNEELRFEFWNEGYKFTENCENGAFLRTPIEVYWKYGESLSPYYVEPGYFDPGYVEGPEETNLGTILVFQGFIHSFPSIDDWIQVIARPTPPKFFPDEIVRKPKANFLPPPGYSVEFDGAILTIED